MKTILAILLLIPSLADAQIIINTGVNRADIERIDRRVDEQQAQIEELRAELEMWKHVKSPPPIGDIEQVKTETKPQQASATPSLRQTIDAYRSSGGRRWYVGYVGNRNKSQLIRHIRDDHKRLTTAELNQYSVDDLLLIHGMCHDNPSLLTGTVQTVNKAASGHWETRRYRQCTKNGCRWYTQRVWVTD